MTSADKQGRIRFIQLMRFYVHTTDDVAKLFPKIITDEALKEGKYVGFPGKNRKG